MSYVKFQDGEAVYPYSIAHLRKDNPNTSFPVVISESTLASFGVYPVTFLDAPEYDVNTQKIEQDDKPVEVNGAWLLGWTITDLSADELEAKAVEKSAEVRMYRGRLLASSDWTQISDAPVDQAAWATYRQSLRDVPQQAGFPFNVTWPQEP